MKTDYTPELRDLLTTMFSPSSPEEADNEALTLLDIHEEVTNILPAKWVDEADVYDALKLLNYNVYQQKHEYLEEKTSKTAAKVSYSLKYFVKRNITASL